MTTLFIVVIVAAVAYYIYYLSHGNHKDEVEDEWFAEQPPQQSAVIEKPKVVIGGSDDDAKIQMLEYFCLVDHGYHVTVWPKDYNQFKVVQFNIAGITHRDGIDDYLGEFVGTLEPEPDNPYDQNAIKVLASDGHHVGYVPKDMTKEIRDNAQLPCPCFCYIGCNDGTYFSECYITIHE